MRNKWVWPAQKRALSIFVALGVLGLGLGAFYLVSSGRIAGGESVCSPALRHIKVFRAILRGDWSISPDPNKSPISELWLQTSSAPD